MPKKKKSVPPASQREAVLLGCLLHGERYGLEIRDEYHKRTAIELPLGSLYTTLDRMQEKGFVTSRMGDPVPNRGGNRRRYFKITGDGQVAFTHAAATAKIIISNVPGVAI